MLSNLAPNQQIFILHNPKEVKEFLQEISQKNIQFAIAKYEDEN
jgi:hypothetical protein